MKIPDAARPIILRCHERYRRLCLTGARPNLDPATRGALLTLQERIELVKVGYYPIPLRVVELGCTPAEYQQRQVLDAVAQQLPEAIACILEGMA